ncbi:MAG: adenylate/guanylate cyclase domain-containing protein [Candidatus Tectimicrobiota bacterium]
MPESLPPTTGAVAALPQRPITVLLVDDQVIIAEAVRRMLVSETDILFHYCRVATEAVKMATELAPTVILQDLLMPEIDGLLLVRFFRAHPATREIPLVVLSTRDDPQVKAEAFACGANDYLVKLPDKVELIARIRYHSKGYISLLERNDAYQALERLAAELERHNRFIRETFGRYLTDDVVTSLLESPAGLQLGGEKRQVTILMSDLRGFTSLSNRLMPEQVVMILNRYLGAMIDVITQYQGTIDEFIGDAILVIFGAPLLREDDAPRAVACAIAMQLAMSTVNAENRAEGLPDVHMGIAVHTGEVVVGNIGSHKRAKYGVVGSAVNLTSRLESYTIGGQILLSEAAQQLLGALVHVTEPIEIDAKGLEQPLTAYDVQGIGAPYHLFLPVRDVRLIPLQEALPVQYTMVEGKHLLGTAYRGCLVQLSTRGGALHTEQPVTPWSDMKIQLLGPPGSTPSGELYAKALLPLPEDPQSVRLHFTSVTPEVLAWFRHLLTQQ